MSEIQPSTTADVNNLATRYLGKTEVWKFGYGSNMGQEFLRTKKKLNPIQFACSILHGYSLSFPEGKGFDFVEPSFATTKIDPNGCIHGVSTLLSIECAEKLNKQEGVGNGGYNLEICKVELYDGSELEVEVYVPSKPLPFDFPEGCCSIRYRDILVTGAKEAKLHPEWITKLENLKIYTPSDETLAKRSKLPPLSSLPVMSIAELSLYNGTSEEYPHHISTCGYIFKLKDMFNVYHGMNILSNNIPSHSPYLHTINTSYIYNRS